jgi:hypothetical protein
MKSKLCFSMSFSEIASMVMAHVFLSLATVAHAQPAIPSIAPNPSIPKPSVSAKDPTESRSSVAAAAVDLVPKPLTPSPYLSSLENSNVFDPQRKMWPDRSPPPSPPPPPPPPPLVTDKDLQLYGVVIVGQTKRATIKVGSRFAQLDTQGRGFVSISEGQVLGEWTLAEIHPTHLVLGAPGGKQNVMFNKKTDRVATAGLQPTQSTLTPSSNETSSNAQSATSASQQSGESNATRTAGAAALGGAPVAGAGSVPSAGSDNTIKNAQPGSLAAAISAAQAAAAAAPPSQNVPPPANFNPFLQLFPKQ